MLCLSLLPGDYVTIGDNVVLQYEHTVGEPGDDAAGLAVSQKMRLQIAGLAQAQKNAKSGISYVQTAEGALTEVHDMLERMYTIAEQSANGTFDQATDRAQLQKELDQLRTEINRIGKTANFNGIGIFDEYDPSTAATSTVGGGGTATPTTDLGDNEAGIKGATFAFADGVEDDAKAALNEALGENGLTFTVQNTGVANADTLADGDSITVNFDSLINAGYAISYMDGQDTPAEAEITAGDKALSVATTPAAGNLAVGTDSLAFTVKDGDGNEVGTITLDLSEIAADGGDAKTTTVTLPVGTAEEENDKGPVAAKYVFDFSGTPLQAGEEVTIAGKTIAASAGGTIDSDEGIGTQVVNLAGALGEGGDYELEGYTVEANGTVLTITANTPGVDKNADTMKTVTWNGNAIALDEANSVEGADGDEEKDGDNGRWFAIGAEYGEANKLVLGKMYLSTAKMAIDSADGTACAADDIGNIDSIDISKQDRAWEALDAIKKATNAVSNMRGTLGATQNRLDHTINNLSVMQENMQDARA